MQVCNKLCKINDKMQRCAQTYFCAVCSINQAIYHAKGYPPLYPTALHDTSYGLCTSSNNHSISKAEMVIGDTIPGDTIPGKW